MDMDFDADSGVFLGGFSIQRPAKGRGKRIEERAIDPKTKNQGFLGQEGGAPTLLAGSHGQQGCLSGRESKGMAGRRVSILARNPWG
jgi:hypothetical protein